MDTPNLLLPMIIVGLFFVLPRVAVSAGHAGDVVAQLFVPPNRSLGWPHGVQESDEPWGWHGGPPDRGSDRPGDPDALVVFEVFDVVDLSWTGDGLVVDVRPVPPTRPHRLAA
jgi:hypothetical protein